MNSVAERVGEVLQVRGELLATAESCTGGLIAERLTQISGASAWYVGGWVTYSNEMKTSQLGVDADCIHIRGAVSWQVAKAMCQGAMKKSGATTSISTTGIAGPSGGTEEKPVGTVFIGCAIHESIQIREFRFTGTRSDIRERTANAAFQMMCHQLEATTIESMCCQHGETIL
tara:strand:- start:14 stop:532 length:519 start_codon:yes stop_codon:yes gene_type:complete